MDRRNGQGRTKVVAVRMMMLLILVAMSGNFSMFGSTVQEDQNWFGPIPIQKERIQDIPKSRGHDTFHIIIIRRCRCRHGRGGGCGRCGRVVHGRGGGGRLGMMMMIQLR